MMARPWPDFDKANSCHHPLMLGASVPIYKLRKGELGFPFAVSIASKSKLPAYSFPGPRLITDGPWTADQSIAVFRSTQLLGAAC